MCHPRATQMNIHRLQSFHFIAGGLLFLYILSSPANATLHLPQFQLLLMLMAQRVARLWPQLEQPSAFHSETNKDEWSSFPFSHSHGITHKVINGISSYQEWHQFIYHRHTIPPDSRLFRIFSSHSNQRRRSEDILHNAKFNNKGQRTILMISMKRRGVAEQNRKPRCATTIIII